MRFSVAELAEAMDAHLDRGDGDLSVGGASIDTRTLESGNVFFALVAERDGHDFLTAAGQAGAGAVVVSRQLSDNEFEALSRDTAVLRVADTESALADLGRYARSRLNGPVIGITGSVGKTSVKDLTRAACTGGRFTSVWAASKSFNNEIGVPLTLANSPDDAQVVIIEMGARGIGHIEYLCGIAMPTIGVVTTVALAHSELFGSIEGVAEGKGELVEALPPDGTAVLNADNKYVAAMADRTKAVVIAFGAGSDHGPAPDVRVADVSLDATLRPTFTVQYDDRSNRITLEARGSHMALNASAAVAAAVAAGVDFDDACTQVASGDLSPWRMEVEPTASGGVVINDAYNANPTSMRAALEALVAAPAERRIAVMGEMAELGEERDAEHLAVAREATESGVKVIAVAASAYGDYAVHVDDIDGAAEAVGSVGAGTAVLVKGSRVAGLERLAERLVSSP